MDAIRLKIDKEEDLSADDLSTLLQNIGLNSSINRSSSNAVELKKSYKALPNAVSQYLDCNIEPKEVKGYYFFSDEEIRAQVEELIINNTWNNNFMPLGAISSV